ncbi:DUF4249 domain-containing protein [Chitinophaga horti]|uniref:DUF4249 domain-containing protein n=1 Tax=Chitinophaga horti TaxID=2920382 RepID=A0ABY6J108_9BACT|nr:DUF4249 domain-containing protein [Chitinophaga horti]UYQ92051.1 DUF4249 domain-containing protein [Chitinophaga horti]
MKKVLFSLIGLFVLAVTACEKKVDVDVPYAGDKIVVNTFMQADSPVYIRVTRSTRPGAVNFEELVAADVQLLEDGVAIPVTRQVINSVGYFVSARNVKYGSSYEVTAIHNGLEPIVAKDSLPLAPIAGNVAAFAGGSRLNFELQDRSDVVNYYRIRVYAAEEVNGAVVIKTALKVRFDASYNSDFMNVISPQYFETNVINDERFNGRKLTIFMQTEKAVPAGQQLILEITSLTPAAYNYLRSFDIQVTNSGNVLTDASKVYTNVMGGYGIVAGINSVRLPFKAN